jgi:nucleoside-diphosphate-sugar epimerase
LEPTNQWYAIAKIAGIKMCQAYRRQYACGFIAAMPTNLYGPLDNFDLLSSHVVPALLVKAHRTKLAAAPNLQVWGTGTARREFLHIDELADAAVHLMKCYSDEVPVNVGSCVDVTIRELAQVICRVVGFDGELVFDSSKPDAVRRENYSTWVSSTRWAGGRRPCLRKAWRTPIVGICKMSKPCDSCLLRVADVKIISAAAGGAAQREQRTRVQWVLGNLNPCAVIAEML